MNMIQLFLEDTYKLQEATALEVYTTVYKPKGMSVNVYFKILSADPTAIIGEGESTEDKLEASKKGKYSGWLALPSFSQERSEIFSFRDELRSNLINLF